MKHILFNIFKGLLLAGAAAACIVFYLYTIDFFAPPPSVGLLTSPSGKTYLDADTLKTALEAEEVEFLTAEPGESYADAANRLLAAGAGVLIVPQDAASVDSSLLEAAETAGATVFFVGESPSDATLNSSAELWYLGSLASHGGEVLGKAIAMDYRDGTVADANGDLLLQYYLYQSTPDEEQTDLANYAASRTRRPPLRPLRPWAGWKASSRCASMPPPTPRKRRTASWRTACRLWRTMTRWPWAARRPGWR